MIRLILLFLLIPSLCFPQSGIMIGATINQKGSGGGGGGSCETEQQAESSISATNNLFGDVALDMNKATEFVYTGTTDKGMCLIDVHGEEVGNVGAKTITIEVRGHDGTENDPDDTIYSTGTFDAADFPAEGSPGWVTDIDLTVNTNLTNGSTYHVVWKMSGSADAVNYIDLSVYYTGTTEHITRDADATGEWSDQHTDRTFLFKLYSE